MQAKTVYLDAESSFETLIAFIKNAGNATPIIILINLKANIIVSSFLLYKWFHLKFIINKTKNHV